MAGQESEGRMDWYELAMLVALNDMHRTHGSDWADRHGIERMPQRGAYWCTKCRQQLADLEGVRNHLHSRPHENRMREKDYLRDPVSFRPIHPLLASTSMARSTVLR